MLLFFIGFSLGNGKADCYVSFAHMAADGVFYLKMRLRRKRMYKKQGASIAVAAITMYAGLAGSCRLGSSFFYSLCSSFLSNRFPFCGKIVMQL